MELSQQGLKFRNRIQNRIIFKVFLLIRLPLAWAAGTRLNRIDEQGCEIGIPYGWRSQNPFRSIYFAAQSMAAEMSTGLLALLAIENSAESVAMLVSDMHGTFTKKADQFTSFACPDGQKMFDAVALTCRTGEPVLVEMSTIGRMKDGTEVSRFTFTWSLKLRTKRK